MKNSYSTGLPWPPSAALIYFLGLHYKRLRPLFPTPLFCGRAPSVQKNTQPKKKKRTAKKAQKGGPANHVFKTSIRKPILADMPPSILFTPAKGAQNTTPSSFLRVQKTSQPPISIQGEAHDSNYEAARHRWKPFLCFLALCLFFSSYFSPPSCVEHLRFSYLR